MAKICQLHADLRYYLCMEPVGMRKQFRGLQGNLDYKNFVCLILGEKCVGE